MPLTKQQLLALPEEQDYRLETLPTGETVRHRIVRRFIQYKIKGDDVIMFRDEQGESWHVIYNLEGGPYKRRVW